MSEQGNINMAERAKRLLHEPSYRRAYLRDRGLPDMSEWWRHELNKEIKASEGKLPSNKRLYQDGKNQAKMDMSDWKGYGSSMQEVATKRMTETVKVQVPDSLGRWWTCPNKCREWDEAGGMEGLLMTFPSARRYTDPACPECGTERIDVSQTEVVRMEDIDNTDPWGKGYVDFIRKCAMGLQSHPASAPSPSVRPHHR